jgi:hypothetical protein
VCSRYSAGWDLEHRISQTEPGGCDMDKTSGKKGNELKSGKTITKKTSMVFVNDGKKCRARFTVKIDSYSMAIISQRLDRIDTCGTGIEGTGSRGLQQFPNFTPCCNRQDMQIIIRSVFTDLNNRIGRE